MVATTDATVSSVSNPSIGHSTHKIQSQLISELPIRSNTLLFGLNFKYTELAKKGLFSRIKGKKQAMDLDLSCLLLDKKLKVIDTVWFKRLRDASQAVRHQGDSLNGKDRGDLATIDHNVDVETIELKLHDLPINVAHVALLISSYYGQAINQVQRGNLYISDDEGNEVYTVDLTQIEKDSPAILVATLSRELSEWRLTLNDLVLEDYQIEKMLKQVQTELARIYTTRF